MAMHPGKSYFIFQLMNNFPVARPIGVTNAGIHARPGRERIFSKHVAHVLNDESQRKYIQVNLIYEYLL